MLNMNGNDERGIVPVLNSSQQTVKIDSLCIKLSVKKQKDDASKCSHFSIRGYVAGMRETGRSNLQSFNEELPPMDVPNFRYWRCQKCLQNYETANASNETTLISAYDHFSFPPTRSNPQIFNGVTALPFGEGTSDIKPVDDMNDNEIILAALGADESQTSQEVLDKVKVYKEASKCGTVDTNAGKKESNELNDHENHQKTSINQPIESDQDNQNELPRRKTRKVRLLKELLCGKTEIQQQKKSNSSSPLMAPISQVKRKMLHDHHDDYDHDCNHHHDHKKMKAFKGDAIAKTNVAEHSSGPEAREFGENSNNDKYEWSKHGTQRSSLLGKVNSDPVTAWRSIFNDVGSDSRVLPTYSVPKSRGTEPYSNFMNPPTSNKNVNSKKITSNPIKSNFFVEDSRKMKDSGRSHAELALDLSLNYEAHPHIRSQPSILNQPPSQDYNKKSSFFLGESSNFPPRIPSESKSQERLVHEKRSYTQLPYGSCSVHQKLDFSDPYKRNIGVKGYSEFTRPNNNNHHQRQEKMLSIGRSDEHEIIELMARNQYERSLCEPKNGMISGFPKLNMNEGMRSSHHEYLNMMRPPSSDNVGPMRSPAGSLFQDQVSNFTVNQKKPLHGVWISDPRSQRHYDSHYNYASNGSNNKMPNTHLYSSSNMQAFEAFNKYNNGGSQKEASGMPFGHTYARYSEKDKGKNMMDLDLNLVAPNVVEEHNGLEPNRMCSFDSSYSNEAIPAMQLLSLMDAGKSSQPFSITSQPFIPKPKPKPISVCYSHCSSTVTEKTNLPVNPIESSMFSVFQAGQNIKLTSSYGQQGYHKPQEKSRGTPLASVGCRPEDSYFPSSWHANEGQNKVNGAFGPRFDSSRTDICTINQNPADFSIPGPHNMYMIGVEDLIGNVACSYNLKFTPENAFGPKSQRKVMKSTS
ncbi:uncharacterized protein LOC143603777 [Bidens hawaiensis]|uniref:uncharacterized protein LOC143603777 n=1 Tax=Bidens hawaiensis TaxID=980011 RepID=UPI00404A51A3